ncbi:MAG: hypothetical protein WD154_05190 [Nitrosopumilaceae archaeon]
MKREKTISIILGVIISIILYYVISDVLFRPCCSPPEIEHIDIPSYYEIDADGNLIKPETTDWLFDKEKPLAEIFEDSAVPHCEYDFAYRRGLTDIAVMCYKGNWYVIHNGWTDTPYRLPEK